MARTGVTGLPLLLKMVQPLPTQRGLTSGSGWLRQTFSTRWARLGLDLLLNLASKAVGVGEADLDLGLLAWLQVVDMGLAREGGGKRRFAICV